MAIFSPWGKISLVNNFLVISEFGDFEASEISLVICVLVVLTSTPMNPMKKDMQETTNATAFNFTSDW